MQHRVVDYIARLNKKEMEALSKAIDNSHKICIIDKYNKEHELSPKMGEVVAINKTGTRVVLVKPVCRIVLEDSPILVIKGD